MCLVCLLVNPALIPGPSVQQAGILTLDHSVPYVFIYPSIYLIKVNYENFSQPGFKPRTFSAAGWQSTTRPPTYVSIYHEGVSKRGKVVECQSMVFIHEVTMVY